ncbi:MAG: LysE family transporter [Rhodocyclales bacterium]|nr:LysE family transporter [Rhodocyclales bacterium]
MPASAFLKGAAIGFAVAAPVGPIGVLCIQRTLAHGRACGFASGLGAAVADAAYGAIAAFGLAALAQLLVGQQAWVRLIGGALLLVLGARALLARPAAMDGNGERMALPRAFASTLALTLTNPATILSFAAIFAGIGLMEAGAPTSAAAALVAGVFAGSAAWWLILSGLTGLLRERLAPHLRWVNLASGLTLVAFGFCAFACGG